MVRRINMIHRSPVSPGFSCVVSSIGATYENFSGSFDFQFLN